MFTMRAPGFVDNGEEALESKCVERAKSYTSRAAEASVLIHFEDHSGHSSHGCLAEVRSSQVYPHPFTSDRK